MRVNEENLNHVIDEFKSGQWKNVGKFVLGAIAAYVGAKTAINAAYDCGVNEATQKTLKYVVDHKDDETFEFK